VDSARIIYASLPNVTPESELAALVNVYSFVLQCAQEKKKAVPKPPPETPNSPYVLPAVRELLARQPPSGVDLDPHDLADEIQARGYMTYRPAEAAVEAALEALSVEGEVLS
jgi:hypothetical protein